MQKQKLGEFFSTAICGNDIFSTTLYVTGISILFAGYYAPLVLLAVAGVLFFYRAVFREVIEALPVNGGSYVALLNATSISVAALAGAMTILSLVAASVLSAKMAVTYLFAFLGRITAFGFEPWTIAATVAVLAIVSLLVMSGMRDSASVAGTIFIFHIATLGIFILVGALYILTYGPTAGAFNQLATEQLVITNGGLLKTIFFAFSASLIGISGFQSSATYVEEQRRGVFSKTLRNMTLGAAIINPIIAAVVLRVLPLSEIIRSNEFLLADAGAHMGGTTLLGLIAVDAFLVLIGALLASLIGAASLMKRMTQDKCLPRVFLKIPIPLFFLLCLSLLALTHGDLLSLAGIYTISFLGVMSLVAVANLVLRKTRSELHRPYRAPFPFIVIALASTVIGLMGNIAIDPKNTGYFLAYFIPATFLILSVLYQKDLFDTLAKTFKRVPLLYRYFTRKHDEAITGRVHVFILHIDRLSSILEYIQKNESVTHVTLIHCLHKHPNFTKRLERALETLRGAGFFTEFTYTVEYLDEPFSPELVDRYAKRKHLQKSRIFMGSLHHTHNFTYEDLGGVRIIF